MAVISWTDPYDLGTAYINIASTTINATLTNATHTITLPAVQLKANLKYFGGPKVRYQLLTDAVDTGWTAYVANNTYASASWNSYSVTTSSYFNSSNPTVKTVSKKINVYELTAYESGESQATTGFDPPSTKTLVTINLTLNAPPVLTNATIKSSTASGIYWTEDSAGESNSSIIVNGATVQYGGTISEATLTVGSLSMTVTGTAYIKMPIVGLEAGTYTPVYTVTDSRGQTSTKTFDPIEVVQYERVTYNITQVQSNTNGFWVGASTASVTVSNIVAPEEVTLTTVRFFLRADGVNKYVQKTLDGTETSITVSSSELIDAVGVGTFTPDVYIKDSRGIWEHNYLDPIVIRQYTNTSLGSATLIRTNQNGIQDDEGAYGLLTINVNYIYQLGNLLEPIVDVTDNGATSSGIVTWYESWNSTTGIDTSSLINWTDYNPTSPVTLYGLISGYGSTTGFDTQRSFQIAVTARDTQTSSDTLTQILDSAFYTIDFLAGGHGIAFGQPCSEDGFWCDMDMYLHGHKVPVIYESILAPTAMDGEDGDIWIQYTV